MEYAPIISIIVPIYKTEKHLPDCIESILSQTFTDFELILVNDGSPDKSGFICDQYAERDRRIKVIHKSHAGASSARNEGLRAALGLYIGWVDSDDQIAPNMYEILYNLAESFHADIAECQYYTVHGECTVRSGADELVEYGDGDFILDEFFNARMKPSLCTKVYRRELWDGIVFPEGRKHQDCYINLSFALMPLKYVRTPEPLYYYFIHENSITTTYTSHELRQAVYLYEYTMKLADTFSSDSRRSKYLVQDAVNRLMGRYFEVSINSNIGNQNVYTHYIKRKLGFPLFKYLLCADLPIKTRISYILVMLNMKDFQRYLHVKFGQSDKKC